jgi:hypothetical protein
VNLDFVIKDWAAYAAGLHAPADWQAWAAKPYLPTGDEQPELREMPAMARRRLGALGRAAVQVAWWCQGGAAGGMPVVLASRYGDAARSLELLAELAREQALSPTAFGLSVHNAIGAQYSIARGDRSNYLSIAAGAAGAAEAVVEAAGLLADGASEVLVVNYDAPLPGDYARFEDEPSACYAWAWKVASPDGAAASRAHLQLSASPQQPTADPHGDRTAALPFGLDVLRFFVAGDARLQRCADGRQWTWQRRQHHG